MDNITLGAISNTITQTNCRIDDMNDRLADIHTRCNETNTTLRLLITENNSAHREVNRKIDQACRLIGNVEKETSVTAQKVDDHLLHHKKEDARMNINGVKITSIAGSFGSALIGATVVLITAGVI